MKLVSSSVCSMRQTGPLKWPSKAIVGAFVLMLVSNASFAQRKATPNLNTMELSKPAYQEMETEPRFVDSKNPDAADLIKLFQEAAQYDPTFLAAKSAYVAGKESYWQAFSVLLPQIKGTFNTSSTDLRFDPNLGRTDYGFSSTGWGVQLSQPLFNWAYFEQYKQGDLLSGVAEYTFAQAQEDLITRISQAYFDALTSQDNLNLYRLQKSLIKEQLEQAKRNFEVGTATIVDTNEAQSRYDLVIAQEIAAQSDLMVKKDALEQIVGRPIAAIFPLRKNADIRTVVQDRKIKILKNDKGIYPNEDIVSSLHIPTGQTLEEWTRQAEDVNYKVIVNRLNAEIAKSTYNASRASRLPTVNLTASTGYNTQLGSTVNATPSTYYANTIGLQLSVPLFTGGYISSTIRQNAALYDQAKANYDLSRRTTSNQTKQAYLGFTSGLSQVRAYEAAEKSALVSLQSNKVGYDVGVRINIDVLNAQAQLITTQATLYKSRYDTIMNGLKLKSYAAVLTDEDLIAVNQLLH